jgi:hypothetical protein
MQIAATMWEHQMPAIARVLQEAFRILPTEAPLFKTAPTREGHPRGRHGGEDNSLLSVTTLPKNAIRALYRAVPRPLLHTQLEHSNYGGPGQQSHQNRYFKVTFSCGKLSVEIKPDGRQLLSQSEPAVGPSMRINRRNEKL